MITSSRLLFPNGEINLATGQIRRSTTITPLSPIEIQFLTYLASHSEELVSLSELHREVWGFSPRVKTRVVYSTVLKLRKLIESDPKSPTLLVGTEGQGFGLRIEAAPNSLIGRDSELTQLRKSLRIPGALINITGPGGVGKTKLLAEVGQDLGISKINAENISDERQLATAISRTFGIKTGRYPIETIKNFLAVLPPSSVLSIDHLESPNESICQTLDEWRQSAPQLCWLIASRAPIYLPNVLSIAVAPLPLVESRQFFYHCLQSSQMKLTINETELDELLLFLDGLPLAIEIAAWQARTLPIRKILEGLADAQSTQLVGPAGSLEASIALSWHRLTEREQLAIARLCTLDHAVPFEPALVTSDLESMELSRLVEHGLIRMDSTQQEPLYSPFKTLQWFVRSRGTSSDGCERLATWWLNEIEGSSNESKWFAKATHPALLSVVLTLAEQQNVQLAGALGLICLRHGSHSSFTPAHEQLIESIEKLPLDPLTRARWDWRYVWLGTSKEAFARAYDALATVAPPNEVIEAAIYHARMANMEGDLESAATALNRAQCIRGSNPHVRLDIEIAFLLKSQGKLHEALQIAKQCLVDAKLEPRWTASALYITASIQIELGLLDEAFTLSKASLSIDVGVDKQDPIVMSKRQIALQWLSHANIARKALRFTEAREALQHGQHLMQKLPDNNSIIATAALLNQALIELDDERPDEAYRILLSGLSQAFLSTTDAVPFQTVLELSRLRCGHSPSKFSTDAAIAMALPRPAEEETTFLGWCAEIAYHSGFYSKAHQYLHMMNERIHRIGYSEYSEEGRMLQKLKQLFKKSHISRTLFGEASISLDEQKYE